MVEIELDASAVAKLTKALVGIKNGVPRVLAPAINRSLNHGRTVIKREIRKDYTIKAKDIPTIMRYATPVALGGSITIKSGMLDLMKFRVRPRTPPNQKGVAVSSRRLVHAEVRIGKGGNLPHAFVARMPNAVVGVFTRVGKERLPIKRRLAIGAPIMASQPHVQDAAGKAMQETLIKRINSQVERLLSKRGTTKVRDIARD